MSQANSKKDLEAVIYSLKKPWEDKIRIFSNPNYLKNLCDIYVSAWEEHKRKLINKYNT